MPATLDALFGSYTAVSLNGLSFPVTIKIEGTIVIDIMSSTLTLSSSGDYFNTTVYKTTEDGQVTMATETCGGRFLVHQSSISFAEVERPNTSCRSRYTGVWNGVNTIEIDFDLVNAHAVFVK